MTSAEFMFVDAVALAALVVLALVAAILVAAEEAFDRSSVARADSLAEYDGRRATRLAQLLALPEEEVRNPLRLLVVLFQLSEAALAAVLAFRFFNQPLSTVLIVANMFFMFVATEALPRTWSILNVDRSALVLAGPAGMLLRFGPSRLLARFLIGLTNVVMPGKGLRQGPFAVPEELIALADAAVEDDVIDETERDLIESAIEFGDTIVREVMVPRTDMVTVSKGATVADVLEKASVVGFSRVPVVGESIDDVVGLAYVKDLIRAELDGHADQEIDTLVRTAPFVPETKKVSELLREMQRETYHMAIAVDEYGGIAGLVTLEDLIEELVGEIVDEYDVEEPLVERLVDGSLRVDARILIDEVNDLGGLQLPEGDWDTVGGLAFDVFGRVPAVGETCEVASHYLKVERVQGRRITKVRVSRSSVAVGAVPQSAPTK